MASALARAVAAHVEKTKKGRPKTAVVTAPATSRRSDMKRKRKPAPTSYVCILTKVFAQLHEEGSFYVSSRAVLERFRSVHLSRKPV